MFILYYLGMKRLFLLCLLSSFVLANSQVSPALGCALHPGDQWFSVKPEITSNPLSRLLAISFLENGSLVTFSNLGLTSDLYIASKDIDGKYPGYDKSMENYRPAEKIIGHDFDPNVLISTGNTLPKGVYTFQGGWSKTNIRESNDNSGTATLAKILDSTDNYKTKQVTRDNRPKTISAPEPDHQTMYAFYEGNRYDIELMLNYSLNDGYNPHKTARSCTNEPGLTQRSTARDDRVIQLSVLVFVSVFFIAFILTPWIYTHAAKKKQLKQPQAKRKAKK